MKTTIRKCPRCHKNRRDGSPVSYVWWIVKGYGLMCWACWDKISASFYRSFGHG
jgi:hypothetical protein